MLAGKPRKLRGLPVMTSARPTLLLAGRWHELGLPRRELSYAFAFEVIRTAREEEPDLFDAGLQADVVTMVHEAVECEMAFAEDLLSGGVPGLSMTDMRQYLEYVADQRLISLGIAPIFGARNPLRFMELQDVQELANFFERRVSAYQVGVTGQVSFAEDF